ncbi:MAG: chemotaxis protein CheW [Planctomycetia bacterium]|nr:chemotaxis protein CheW [Planctomycetia bacterium]
MHTRTAEPAAQFVGFDLDGQQYLLRIERIQEIITPGPLTRLPEVPAYVLGVSNLRGAIIPVVDLRRLFGLAPRDVDADTRTIVAVVGDRTVGCMVDAVSHVIRLPADRVSSATEAMPESGPRFVAGFARVGEGLAIVLDVDELLAPDKLEAVHRAGLPQPPAPIPSAGAPPR